MVDAQFFHLTVAAGVTGALGLVSWPVRPGRLGIDARESC